MENSNLLTRREDHANGTIDARFVYVEPLSSDPDHRRAHGLLEIWELVRDRKLALLLILLLVIATATVYTLLQRPMFSSSSAVEIQVPGASLGMAAMVSDGQADSFMRTQVRLLESKALEARVKQSLSSEGRRWSVQPSLLEQWAGEAGLKVKAPATDEYLPPVKLNVHAYEGTRIIELTAQTTDPEFATEYVNTVVREFGSSEAESRLKSAQEASNWIVQQIEDTRTKLRKAESDMEAFGRSGGGIYGADQTTVDQARLTQLEAELARASADRYQKQSNFEIAKQNSVETIPQVADNNRISEYSAKLVDLRRESAELRAQLTPEHYKVQRVEAQIRELELIILKERQDVVGRMLNDYNSALRREELLRDAYQAQRKVVDKQAGMAASYDILKREVDSDRKLYDELLEKSKSANLETAMTGSTVRVIDPAETPTIPYSPTPVRTLAVALLSGLVGGVFLIIVSDQVNRKLKAPGETPYHLKIPELGIIPSHELDAKYEQRSRKELLSLRPAGLNGNGNGNGNVPVWNNSSSMVAESIRSTVASILSQSQGYGPLQVILVTSSNRGDGKSCTVASLGVALAEIGQRVLLIDADMRKPDLHYLFKVGNSWGLSNLLREKTLLQEMPLEAIAQSTENSGLSILTSGPGTATIANLLYSQRLNLLLERVRKDFDVILIDTPPMSFISDARILGRVADGVVLVIRAGETTREEALAAKETLMADKTRLLGTILNGWNPKSKPRYGYSSYAASDRT